MNSLHIAVPNPLFLEDLTVGDEFRSDEHRIDVEQIIAFARQFDPQPFHLNDAAARSTLFDGLAASGWHTAAVTMKLLVSSIPFGSGIIGAGGDIAWPRPTRPKDVLQVISTITDIRPSKSKPDRGMVTVECLTLNQRGETCQRLIAKLVVMRKKN